MKHALYKRKGKRKPNPVLAGFDRPTRAWQTPPITDPAKREQYWQEQFDGLRARLSKADQEERRLSQSNAGFQLDLFRAETQVSVLLMALGDAQARIAELEHKTRTVSQSTKMQPTPND